MAEKIKVLITEEEVDARIRELGEKISKEYEGKQIHLICVLKGGVFFMCELAKRITVPVSMDFMCVGSYGDGTKSSGVVRLAKDLDESIENKEVLIVEDIIDSGNTLYYLMDVLRQRKPASLRLCTFLSILRLLLLRCMEDFYTSVHNPVRIQLRTHPESQILSSLRAHLSRGGLVYQVRCRIERKQ